MSKTALIVVIVAVFLVLIVGVPSCVSISSYNNLVMLSETVDSSRAQVKTVLQRRYDLIPNLVSTVKGFAANGVKPVHQSGQHSPQACWRVLLDA